MRKQPWSAPVIDRSLTPQNAKSKGYQWVDDVFLDRLDELAVLLADEVLCLGTPQLNEEGMVGLYMPLGTQ